jgi:hypothetical protein
MPPVVPLAEITGDAPGNPKVFTAVEAGGVWSSPLEITNILG